MPAAAASSSAPPRPLGRRPAPPGNRYVVTLTAAEQEQLEALVRSGRRSSRSITRAHIPLLTIPGNAGPGWEDRRVAAAPARLGKWLKQWQFNASAMTHPRPRAAHPRDTAPNGPRGR